MYLETWVDLCPLCYTFSITFPARKIFLYIFIIAVQFPELERLSVYIDKVSCVFIT
jgi:hypothetical protein